MVILPTQARDRRKKKIEGVFSQLPIALIDVLTDFATEDGLIPGPVRLAPILRPVIFTANVRRVRETMLSTLKIIWDVKELLCLITCLVIWFGMLMFVLFNQCVASYRQHSLIVIRISFNLPRQAPDSFRHCNLPLHLDLVMIFVCIVRIRYCRPEDGCDERPYYGTLGLSFLSTFTILTTANFPDVMM